MLARRPFDSESTLRVASDEVWHDCGVNDWLEAFEGHPKIGDMASLQRKYADTQALAAGEQAGVQGAATDTLERLAAGNHEYEERFGFIFIVCASGKSADEMLDLLEARLGNSREEELSIAAQEQRKITQIRLDTLL